MKELKNKKGFIMFYQSTLDQLSIDSIKMLFSNFYPFSIDNDMLYMCGKISFYGYSEHFEEMEEATVIPEYIATITNNNEGEAESIKFDKVN